MDATFIGLGSMLGAGVFVSFGPAAKAAGAFLGAMQLPRPGLPVDTLNQAALTFTAPSNLVRFGDFLRAGHSSSVSWQVAWRLL